MTLPTQDDIILAKRALSRRFWAIKNFFRFIFGEVKKSLLWDVMVIEHLLRERKERTAENARLKHQHKVMITALRKYASSHQGMIPGLGSLEIDNGKIAREAIDAVLKAEGK